MKTSGYPEIDSCIKYIQMRNLAEGGFAEQTGGFYRPDSTAWAILVLRRERLASNVVDSARDRLQENQGTDGRVSMPGDQGAFWPTSLAILAWMGSKQHEEAQRRAVKFLLETNGAHWKNSPDSPFSHDTSIKGWPWTENTHSWIEPTALALIALDVAGHREHPRIQEGIQMIMDRQLSHGGWNYGNTTVYGQELHPFIDTTGVALTALAGHVTKESVMPSIQFLKEQVNLCKTPLSLGWALFGLGAWKEFPSRSLAWIGESLKRQERYGTYRTSLLSLLALASISQGDLRKCVL
jgi:hypothetical protein